MYSPVQKGPLAMAMTERPSRSPRWKEGLESVLSTAWPVVINFVIDYVRSVSGARRLQNAGHLLHQCCTSLNADASVLENILKDCTDVDCRNEDGRTPL